MGFKAQPIKVIKGPCFVKYGANAFVTKGDVKVAFKGTYEKIPTGTGGNIGSMLVGMRADITFSPREFTALAALFAFKDWVAGQPIFSDAGGADEVLSIYSASTSAAGKTDELEFSRAGQTGFSALTLGVKADPLADLTYTALPNLRRGGLTDRGVLALETVIDAPFTVPALVPANIMRIPAIGKIGDIYFDMDDGAQITFNVPTTEDSTCRTGVHNLICGDIEVSAQLKAKNISESDWRSIAKLYGTTALGGVLGLTAPDLILRGAKAGDYQFTLPRAECDTDKELLFSRTENRFGALTFNSYGDDAGKRFLVALAAADVAFDDLAPLPAA